MGRVLAVARRPGGGWRQLHPPPPLPSLVQATPMSKQRSALVPSIFAPWVLAVHFSMGPAVCHVCLSDAWVLRCVMVMFCVKEADWGTMAFVAEFAPWFSQ